MSDQSPRGGVDPRRCVRWLPAGLAACVLASAFPGAASATDYCVDPVSACGPKNVTSFQEALTQAASASDADRIFLGPGPHEAPDASGFLYDNPSGPVEILGTGTGGPDGTIVTTPAGGNGNVLSLTGGPGTSVHDLTIQIPQNVAFGLAGLRTNGAARDIHVRASQTQTSPYMGVVLHGGTLERASVVAGAPNTYAVYLDSAGGTVRRSAVRGDSGIVAGNGALIENSRAGGTTAGIKALTGTVTIRSSHISTQGASGAALLANPPSGASATVVADGVNLVGVNGSQSAAAYASTPAGSGSSAKVALINSLIRRFPTTLRANDGGSGPAEVVTSYSDYASSSSSASGPMARSYVK